MGVTIERASVTEGGALYTLTEKLWTTQDGKVVKDGDPAAHQLVGTAGSQIPIDRAKALGLVHEPKAASEAAPAEAAKPKSRRKAAK